MNNDLTKKIRYGGFDELDLNQRIHELKYYYRILSFDIEKKIDKVRNKEITILNCELDDFKKVRFIFEPGIDNYSCPCVLVIDGTGTSIRFLYHYSEDLCYYVCFALRVRDEYKKVLIDRELKRNL